MASCQLGYFTLSLFIGFVSISSTQRTAAPHPAGMHEWHQPEPPTGPLAPQSSPGVTLSPGRDQAAHCLRVYQLDPFSSDASSFDLGSVEDGTSYLDAWQ